MFTPTDNPVTPDVGDDGVVTVALPAITVQIPVPTRGVFAASVAVVEQIVWSGPAAEIVATGSTVMVTLSADGGQVPFEIVQTNVFVPTLNPLTPGVAEVVDVRVPVPAVIVHIPDPIIGMFPFKTEAVEQIVESNPALATVGKGSIIRLTESMEEGHVPFEMVQTNVFVPTVNPVTPEVGELGVVTDPPPEKTVQIPVPTIGVFPFKEEDALQKVLSAPAFETVGF